MRAGIKSAGMKIPFSACLAIAAGLLLAPLSAGDVAGSADHPLLKRLEGSTIFFSKTSDYERLKLALGKLEWDGGAAKVKPYESTTVEGKLLTNYYQAPGQLGVMEALRNYEEELRSAGFEILFSGQGEEIETPGYNNQIAREILGMTGTYGTPEEKAQWPFQHTDEKKAFDLSTEPKATLDAYGDTRFGRGCLLARRLAEAGARFLSVTTEYVPFLHWDTHENGHETAARLKREVDRPIARLILDLEERGMLDRTLVIIASEFSRDMMMEGAPGSQARDQSRAASETLEESVHYGLHRHFTGGSSVVLFGGGMKKGHVHGATAGERPLVAIKDPVGITDLHATIFTAMGISPKSVFDIEKRPFYATEDGKGVAVRSLFA